jgi:hypothetical protein
VAGGFEDERRRLAGMLPGAEIERAAGGDEGAIELVALVRDVDLPIPVLVERGGYEYPAVDGAQRTRRLVRGKFRLVLVDSRAEFAARVAATGGGSSGSSAP